MWGTLGILGLLGAAVAGSALEATTTPLDQAVPLERKLYPPGGLQSLPTPEPIEVFDQSQCSDVTALRADPIGFSGVMAARAPGKIVYEGGQTSSVFLSCQRADGSSYFGEGNCGILFPVYTAGADRVCSVPLP